MLRHAVRLLPSSYRAAPQLSVRAMATTTGSEPGFALPLDTLIKADHNKVRHLFNVYNDSSTNQEGKQLVAYTIIRELSMHSSKEEEVVYPVIGKIFGHDEQQHLLDEHMAIKVKLERLSKMDLGKDESAYDKLIRSVQHDFEHHIKEEEEQEIPRLLSSPGVNPMELGLQFEKAAAHAVTRPHPWAPDKPPLNLVTNRMTAPLDAMADQVRFKGDVPEVPPTPM